MKFLNNLTKSERQFIAACSLFLIFLTTATYVYAWAVRPPGTIYNGVHAVTAGDIPVYLSYIQEIKSGGWLIHDRLTGEDNTGIFNIIWLICGLVARFFHLSPLLAFHLVRILLIPLFCLCAYYCLSVFIEKQVIRKISMILFCFAAGFGALISPFILIFFGPEYYNERWPLDLWVPEMNPFISLYNSPHMVATWILCLLMITFIFQGLKDNSFKYSILAGLIGLIWFSFHPFYAPLVYVIIVLWSLILFFKNRNIKSLLLSLLVIGLSIPSVFYHYYLIQIDPVLAERAAQNILITPRPFYLLIGFGALFVCAVIEIVRLYQNKKFTFPAYHFLALWALVGLLMPYAPIFFQRRLILGAQLPMAIFSAIILFEIWVFLRLSSRPILRPILLSLGFLLFCSTNIYHIAREIKVTQNYQYYLYSPIGLKEAAEFLNTQDKKVVLSDLMTAIFLPTYGNLRVFSAHGIETIHAEEKFELTSQFFSGKMDTKQIFEFVKNNNISHLVVGNYGFIPNPSVFDEIYEADGYKVYKVIKN